MSTPLHTDHVETELRATVALFNRGDVELRNLVLPARGDDEVDVAISCAAICGSDLHTYLGHRKVAKDTVLGHEGVGVVAGIDQDSSDLAGNAVSEGDRVVFALFSACGSCDRCSGGLMMKCRSLLKYGHEPVDVAPFATGTLATHVRLAPGVPFLKVPEGVDDAAVVSAGCAVATAAGIVRTVQLRGSGETVLIFGAGAVGYYCAAMFLDLGYRVVVKDPAPPRLAAVEALGARSLSASDTDFPVVVETSGSPTAVVEGLVAADVGGVVVLAGSVSLGHTSIEIDPAVVVTRRLEIVGVHNYTTDDFLWGSNWLFIRAADLDLNRLTSPAAPLTDLAGAFHMMRQGRYHRVLVEPLRAPAS